MPADAGHAALFCEMLTTGYEPGVVALQMGIILGVIVGIPVFLLIRLALRAVARWVNAWQISRTARRA